MKIDVIISKYVSIVTSGCFAGFITDVEFIDIDGHKVIKINSGEASFYEALQRILRWHLLVNQEVI